MQLRTQRLIYYIQSLATGHLVSKTLTELQSLGKNEIEVEPNWYWFI